MRRWKARRRERMWRGIPSDVRAMVEQARAVGLRVPDFDWYYGRVHEGESNEPAWDQPGQITWLHCPSCGATKQVGCVVDLRDLPGAGEWVAGATSLVCVGHDPPRWLVAADDLENDESRPEAAPEARRG